MKTTSAQATQQHLNIAQVKNGVVFTRTGGLRAILTVKPVNFALKSEADQNVMIGQYQNFLNALQFPVQIVIQSRRLDLHPYLKALREYAQQLPADLLRLQAMDYIDFMTRLTTLANIMDKQFYMVVPYDPAPIQKVGVLGKLFGGQRKEVVRFSALQLQKFLAMLKERVAVVRQGLAAIGLESGELSTQQVIELYYRVYNPEEATEERLTKVEELEAPVIQRDKAVHAEPVVSQPVENKAMPLNEVQGKSEAPNLKS